MKRPVLSPSERALAQLRETYKSELPSLEELMREQGISGPQGRALWESYPQGTPEEEEAFYRVMLEECW